MENLRNAVVVVGARFIEPDVSRKRERPGSMNGAPMKALLDSLGDSVRDIQLFVSLEA
jgi:hypothetical protein